MSGIKMINAQLEAVSNHIDSDWNDHDQLMAMVDAELEELNFAIKNVIDLRDHLGRLDEIIYQKVTSGVIPAPSLEDCTTVKGTIDLFEVVGKFLVARASSLVTQGFKIEGLSRIRAIGENPGGGLHLLHVLAMAQEMDQGDGTLQEIEFGNEVFSKLTEIGKRHPATHD